MIKDGDLPKNEWRIGKVEEFIIGTDGLEWLEELKYAMVIQDLIQRLGVLASQQY